MSMLTVPFFLSQHLTGLAQSGAGSGDMGREKQKAPSLKTVTPPVA